MPVKYRNRYGRVRTYETTYNGIVEWLERKRNEADGDWSREQAEQYMREVECTPVTASASSPRCSRCACTITTSPRSTRMTIDEAIDFFAKLKLTKREETIARQVIKEIVERLTFLMDVGLDYLTLSRASATLSGGEAQRIRLASQIGSYLVGVLYVLDEPSIGLHQRDNRRLIATLERLRDLGNSVIVVEHDEETIRLADYIVDIGPGAGEFGGEVVHAGHATRNCSTTASPSPVSTSRVRSRSPSRRHAGRATARNSRSRVREPTTCRTSPSTIPLGDFVAVTGVSGSGKSSLINAILLARSSIKSTGPRPARPSTTRSRA